MMGWIIRRIHGSSPIDRQPSAPKTHSINTSSSFGLVPEDYVCIFYSFVVSRACQKTYAEGRIVSPGIGITIMNIPPNVDAIRGV